MVILDVKTRWNSTYDMLVRANELKEVKFVFIFNLYIYILKLKIISLFLAT